MTGQEDPNFLLCLLENDAYFDCLKVLIYCLGSRIWCKEVIITWFFYDNIIDARTLATNKR